MIRINLLGGERQKTARGIRFDVGQQLTAMCSLLVVAAACGVGYWYWTLSQEDARLTAQIASSKTEVTRLESLLAEVKTFEDRRGILQQRVNLIERLRQGQTVPVQLLDHVSRSMPDMLWLTDIKTEGTGLTIEGKSTTLIGLSDFVGNLGSTEVLQKPIEIVDSQVEGGDTVRGQKTGPDLIHFKVKASLNGLPEENKKGKR
jgi:Tfp pilus assembly protein PilN